MTNFLDRALEQGKTEERETGMEVEIPSLRVVFPQNRTETVKTASRQGNVGERWAERNGTAESVLERRGRERMGETPAEAAALGERTLGQLAAGMRVHGVRPYEDGMRGERGGGEWGENFGEDRETGETALFSAVRRAERAADLVRGSRRNLTVTVPETAGGETAGLTVEELDRAAERDARRYDGGFSMY